jgi:hypothetical protein
MIPALELVQVAAREIGIIKSQLALVKANRSISLLRPYAINTVTNM